MSEVKTCGRCGEEKALSDFHRFKGNSDGRQAYRENHAVKLEKFRVIAEILINLYTQAIP